jgi:hypothetical protein
MKKVRNVTFVFFLLSVLCAWKADLLALPWDGFCSQYTEGNRDVWVYGCSGDVYQMCSDYCYEVYNAEGAIVYYEQPAPQQQTAHCVCAW